MNKTTPPTTPPPAQSATTPHAKPAAKRAAKSRPLSKAEQLVIDSMRSGQKLLTQTGIVVRTVKRATGELREALKRDLKQDGQS